MRQPIHWTSPMTVQHDAADFELPDVGGSFYGQFGEVSHATMCPTVQCPSCWCPRDQVHDTDQVFPLLDTQEVYEETAAESKKLLDPNGQIFGYIHGISL